MVDDCRYMSGKALAPKATPEVSAVIEAEIRRLVSRPGDWEMAALRLTKASDPANAYSFARNDWYRLRRALEVTMVCDNNLLLVKTKILLIV